MVFHVPERAVRERISGHSGTPRPRKGAKMKKQAFLRFSLLFILLGISCLWRPSAAGVGDDDGTRAQKGLQIAPVPLDLTGKSRTLVGLGSYLVNAVAGCNDCHTHPSYAPGGNPFLGQPTQINMDEYLAGGRKFGPFTSANITPDASGLPAGLTYKEFLGVLRTGHDPNTVPLLQVMPWPVYGNMLDHDIRAIYEYLRAIPSLPDNPNPGP
jgi:hypothetical protein